MSVLWKKLHEFSHSLETIIHHGLGDCDEFTVTYDNTVVENGIHKNVMFQSEKLDLGHISIIDMREKRGMWMMHFACFADGDYPMPIFGFDIICGKNKVTGCFHDVSPVGVKSQAEQDFRENVKEYVPERTRELPPWAKEIFSDSMLVQGVTKNEDDIDNLTRIGLANLTSWISELSSRDEMQNCMTYRNALSKYCYNQLQNTNSKNVMISLGLEESYVDKFKRVQFPY